MLKVLKSHDGKGKGRCRKVGLVLDMLSGGIGRTSQGRCLSDIWDGCLKLRGQSKITCRWVLSVHNGEGCEDGWASRDGAESKGNGQEQN